jgi:hypothetical protein
MTTYDAFAMVPGRIPFDYPNRSQRFLDEPQAIGFGASKLHTKREIIDPHTGGDSNVDVCVRGTTMCSCVLFHVVLSSKCLVADRAAHVLLAGVPFSVALCVA